MALARFNDDSKFKWALTEQYEKHIGGKGLGELRGFGFLNWGGKLKNEECFSGWQQNELNATVQHLDSPSFLCVQGEEYNGRGDDLFCATRIHGFVIGPFHCRSRVGQEERRIKLPPFHYRVGQ